MAIKGVFGGNGPPLLSKHRLQTSSKSGFKALGRGSSYFVRKTNLV